MSRLRVIGQLFHELSGEAESTETLESFTEFLAPMMVELGDLIGELGEILATASQGWKELWTEGYEEMVVKGNVDWKGSWEREEPAV